MGRSGEMKRNGRQESPRLNGRTYCLNWNRTLPGAILCLASGARYAIKLPNLLEPQLEPRRGGEIIAGGKRSAAPG